MSIIQWCYHKSMRMIQIILKPIFKNRIENYEAELRKRNSNRDFSLIDHTCMGGVIYHRLGLQFQSPTINLWLTLEDYVKLCLNLEYYMGKPVVFDVPYKKVPIGRIDDIKIHFKHYKTEKEALEKWEERKKRINYNNLYAIAKIHSLEDYETVKPLLNTNIFKKIAVLSNVKVDDKRITYIRPHSLGSNRINYLDSDAFGFRTFEKEFDFVSFLN